MKMFKVPKKVNRHVLKAVNILSEGNIKKRISTAVILDQVKYQMRNVVPVPNIEKAVQNSLNNLSDFGLIERVGPNRFSIAPTYAPPAAHRPRPNALDQGLFCLACSRKRRASDVQPSSSRRREQSEYSVPSVEFDQTSKRVHRNDRKFQRSGKSAAKARHMGDKSSPSKEYTEKLQVSASSAADMAKILPESSNMTKLQSANTSDSYYYIN